MKNLIFVTYDGIQNSVFSGQVVEPLLKKINNDPTLKVYIVSFEKNHLSKETINQYIPIHKNLNFIYYRRLPVLGKLSLYPSIYCLNKIIKQCNNYEIVARGPIAGWIVMKSINQKCLNYTLQARGLLTQEYSFSHLPQKNIFKHFLHTWRRNQLYKIEYEAYTSRYEGQNTSRDINFSIKSVSNALTDYLVKAFDVNYDKITLELDDIPESIPNEQKMKWRQISRNKLNIAENTPIFCYNGAVKAWQCPELVIEYFQNQLIDNPNSFLLILSQDKNQFEIMCKNKNLTNYKVLSIAHKEVYQYLCASDYGLIFRKTNHIINWISRPVKAMEYKSAGLKIIHNNTVDWLIKEN